MTPLENMIVILRGRWWPVSSDQRGSHAWVFMCGKLGQFFNKMWARFLVHFVREKAVLDTVFLLSGRVLNKYLKNWQELFGHMYMCAWYHQFVLITNIQTLHWYLRTPFFTFFLTKKKACFILNSEGFWNCTTRTVPWNPPTPLPPLPPLPPHASI